MIFKNGGKRKNRVSIRVQQKVRPDKIEGAVRYNGNTVRGRPDFGGVGVDTLSPDPGRSVDMPVHYAVLGADKLIIENLDLAGVPEAGAVLVIAPLKARGAPEAPARVFALVEGRADAVSRIDRAR